MTRRPGWLGFVVLGCVSLGMTATAWALDITDYGGHPDGSDTSPALTSALVDAQQGRDRTIHFGAGRYTFLTPPPVLTGHVRLTGEGRFNTFLVRAYSGEEFLVGHGDGLEIRDLALWAGAGTSGGAALHLIASDAIGQGGKHVIEDIRIHGDGTWALPLHLDGLNRLTHPIGMRAVTLRSVMIWHATLRAVEWWNCISCEWFGGGAWTGHGTTDGIVIGGPLAQKNYIEADIDWRASTVWPGAMRAR